MTSSLLDAKWIWHPDWTEGSEDSAGPFIHFRKYVAINKLPTEPLQIQISADTKYKLYINSKLVCLGPVKGDQHLWFYDEVDIQPHLRLGINHIAVRVLRFYYAIPFATSFPRLGSAGLLVKYFERYHGLGFDVSSDTDWETALDLFTRLPSNLDEDAFLHVYEDVDNARDLNTT